MLEVVQVICYVNTLSKNSYNVLVNEPISKYNTFYVVEGIQY